MLVGTGKLYPTPDDNSEALDSNLKFTVSGDAPNWSIESGTQDDYYYDGDSLRSSETMSAGEETWLQAIVDSDSTETIKFYWKISAESGYDYLQFYIDDTLKDEITGEQDWQQKSYTVSSGIHTLKWCYAEDNQTTGGDCGWVDFVQWSGPSPEQDQSNWQTINYKHDLYGRRIEKKVDGFSTRYLYDGPQVIAEYDGNNNLLRKYIYGPGIDQPVCMIEEADDETYYYHYDGLGSVVALSDSAGDTVQTYEYSVYGQVAVEDINHPNPYMFAGRRFDIEIGLYYNRARYYNPYTGRFLQTDPIGYGGGMNLYAYCGNSPIGRTDPSGCHYIPSINPITLEERGLVHIHVTIPVEIILRYPEGMSDSDIAMATHNWFRDQGVLDAYDHRSSGGLQTWSLDDVWVDGDYLELIITSWASTWVEPCAKPVIKHRWANVVMDYTPTIYPGGPKDPTLYADVPLLVVDGITILDNKSLNWIIEPAIQEINNWDNDSLTNGMTRLTNLYLHWDTWFADAWGPFKYESGLYRGAEINYIAGGHAFRHYGFTMKWMEIFFKAWKGGYGHWGDAGLHDTWYWMQKGYNEYYYRSSIIRLP